MDVTASPSTQSRSRAVITPRTPEIPFEQAPVPRHWFGARRVPTALANGVNLLFPAGERFFVRAVRHYLSQIQDPELLAQVKGFAGQEGRHAKAHEDFFAIMESQGFRIRTFLDVYNRIAYDFTERVSSPALRLATTAAVEHFTAMLAENALTQDEFDHIHSTMRDLLLWHAAEEIEHKSVAFDVFQLVDGRYGMRMAGLAMGTFFLSTFWFIAAVMLLIQDLQLGPAETPSSVRRLDGVPLRERSPLHVFVHGIKQYIRRDFHPSNIPNDHLARDYFARNAAPTVG